MKKLLCLLSVVLMLTALIIGGAFSASAEKDGGTCGVAGNATSVQWDYDTDTKVLVIKGNGAMRDGYAPWEEKGYSSEIKTVKISKNITAIGSSSFSGCTALTEVIFDAESKLTSVGSEAFNKCEKLTSITLPQGVEEIGVLAFYDCKKLATVAIPSTVKTIGASAFRNTAVKTIHFCGDQEAWDLVEKGENWNAGLSSAQIVLHGTNWENVNADVHKGVCIYGDYVEEFDHDWNEGTVTKQPTCSATGARAQSCASCGATRTADVEIDPEAHKWDSGVVVKAATHKEEGVKQYTCVHCHAATRTESISKVEHAYSGKYQDYGNSVLHKHLCDCGEFRYELHHWDEGFEIKAATHTVPGQTIFYCLDCGYLKTELSPMTPEHTMGEWEQLDEFYHQKKCICADCKKEDCECVDSDDKCSYVEYELHQWDEGVIVTPASHTASGEKKYTCTSCGFSKTEILPKSLDHEVGENWLPCTEADENLEWHKKVCEECNATLEFALHTWDEGRITKVPNHDRDGEMTYTCSGCGKTKVEVILGGHTVEKWTKESDTYHKGECRCGEEIYGAHVWGEPTRTEPTCVKEGKLVYTCVDCNATRTETIPKLNEHKFADNWTAEKDQHKKVCELCKKEEIREDHQWDDGVITTKPSHTVSGTKTYTCETCGATKEEKLPVIAHAHGGFVDHDDKQHKKVCSCGDAIYSDHTWNEGVAEEGQTRYTCQDCGKEKTIAIEPDVVIEEEEEGCGSVLSVGVGMMMLFSLGAVGLVYKKKEQ